MGVMLILTLLLFVFRIRRAHDEVRIASLHWATVLTNKLDGRPVLHFFFLLIFLFFFFGAVVVGVDDVVDECVYCFF